MPAPAQNPAPADPLARLLDEMRALSHLLPGADKPLPCESRAA